MRRIASVLAVTAAILLAGCAGTVKNMKEIADEGTTLKPRPEEAVVVFMRPSGLGFAIQSSVFEIKNDAPSLVGIVAAKTKVAHRVPAGKHLYMVVGESADFMTAELAPNKTYYAYVSPRMGMWKARFALEPKQATELDAAEFKSDYNECRLVEITPESNA
ncbi:MAG: hypothetical protein QG584_2382 [Pseudomonadota bacterium]|nr:hypothetical protein [Pseudomonadota bacterium]